MSASFFSEDPSLYSIKGPMGKGIFVQPEGLHVAFAAGTGVLTFMDTVAYAARIALAAVHGGSVRMSRIGMANNSINKDTMIGESQSF